MSKQYLTIVYLSEETVFQKLFSTKNVLITKTTNQRTQAEWWILPELCIVVLLQHGHFCIRKHKDTGAVKILLFFVLLSVNEFVLKT